MPAAPSSGDPTLPLVMYDSVITGMSNGITDHSDHSLSLLDHLRDGFEPHLKHGCVSTFFCIALAFVGPLSKESYQMSIKGS
jgi:hypothetical protein